MLELPIQPYNQAVKVETIWLMRQPIQEEEEMAIAILTLSIFTYN